MDEMTKTGIIAILIIFFTAAVAGAGSPPSAPPSLREVIGEHFEVVGLDGQPITLESMIGAGRPVVIEFWATWCAPCRKSVAHLRELKRKHGDEIVILGLTVDDYPDDVEKVRSFLRQYEVDYPISFAPDALFQFMNQRTDIAVPKLFVFDRTGDLVQYLPRYSLFTRRHLFAAVDRALSSSPERSAADEPPE